MWLFCREKNIKWNECVGCGWGKGLRVGQGKGVSSVSYRHNFLVKFYNFKGPGPKAALCQISTKDTDWFRILVFAISSSGAFLKFSACSLVMFHIVYEHHKCSGLRENIV